MKRIVLVVHTDKLEVASLDLPVELRPWILADPPLSMQGIIEAHAIYATTAHLGPFTRLFCSRLQRAAQVAAIIACRLGIDFSSLSGLGQYGSKEGEQVFDMPGHESESWPEWMENGVIALHDAFAIMRKGENALATSHRPVAACLAEFASGNPRPEAAKAAIGKWGRKPYLVFEKTDDVSPITLVEE